MKSCTKCGEVKSFAEFSKDKYRKDGYCVRCKSCRRQHYLDNAEKESIRQMQYWHNNRERYRETSRAYYESHKSEYRDRARKWYEANKDVVLQNCQNWREKNRERVAGYTRERRRKQEMATPSWVNMERVESFYASALMLTAESGIKYCVDHIVPIVSDYVCGLHCEDNLQIMTVSENAEKSNLHWPDMP